MTGSGTPRKRLLIGAGCFADARAALLIADRLAAVTASDLGGFLFEDRTETDIAAPAPRRVVSSRGTLLMVPPPRQMQLLRDSDARAFRQMLHRMAERAAARWSFERRQGDPVGELCTLAGQWDWVLIGHRRVGAHRGRVVMLAPPDGESGDLAALADSLAAALRIRRVTLPAGPDEAEILAQVDRIPAEVVLIDARHGPIRDIGQIRRLLGAARCPVLILGADAIRRPIEHGTQIPPAPPG